MRPSNPLLVLPLEESPIRANKLKNLVAIISFSSFIVTLAIAGLVMDESGVPWFSEGVGPQYDFSEGSKSYDYYESQDWDECCEQEYASYSYLDSDLQQEQSTDITSITPLTIYFVLALIFASILLIIAPINMPNYAKMPITTLLGLAITTVGIFLTRKFVITLSLYFDMSTNLGSNSDPSHYLHVMVYFGGFLGLACLGLGGLVISSANRFLDSVSLSSRFSFDAATNFLLFSLIVFLISPMFPIAYISTDQSQSSFDEGIDPDSIHLYPAKALVIDDQSANSEESDVVDSTVGNYALVENLFLAIIWINLGIIMLISLTLIPKIGFVFEWATQINILSIILIILSTTFTTIMYVNLPKILGADGIFSDETYASFSYNINWIIPIVCLTMLAIWFKLLIKSYLPWMNLMLNQSSRV